MHHNHLALDHNILCGLSMHELNYERYFLLDGTLTDFFPCELIIWVATKCSCILYPHHCKIKALKELLVSLLLFCTDFGVVRSWINIWNLISAAIKHLTSDFDLYSIMTGTYYKAATPKLLNHRVITWAYYGNSAHLHHSDLVWE